jgi:putative nucleotidyltransferase with HDIG domain
MMTHGAARQIAAAAAGAALVATAWAEQARRSRRYSAQLHRASVEALLNALHAGDPFTARHSRRVADLAETLARAHGLPHGQRTKIRLAGLLHDMGKLDEELFPIVHSSERLSGGEREKIEEHPDGGAHILEPLEEIHPGLIEIVESHHENWNGGGYPRGLSGEEIPLGARIISIADVFDALTQPRVYRDATSVEDALELIGSGGGSRFDPELIATLQRPEVLECWVEIAEAGRREEHGAVNGSSSRSDSSEQR